MSDGPGELFFGPGLLLSWPGVLFFVEMGGLPDGPCTSVVSWVLSRAEQPWPKAKAVKQTTPSAMRLGRCIRCGVAIIVDLDLSGDNAVTASKTHEPIKRLM